MEGQLASPIGPATGRGVLPAAETRHRPVAAARFEENTISRLSAVHAGGPMMGRLSKVRRLASPPLAGITKMSLLTPATVERTNATWVPSAENDGSRSTDSPGGE